MAGSASTQDIPLADEGEENCPTMSECVSQRVRPAEPLPRPDDDEDEEEKARLIAQVLELQNTLDGRWRRQSARRAPQCACIVLGTEQRHRPYGADLSQRVDSVKEESIKLRQENQVLGQYIHNLMAASSIFQSATPKSTK